VVDAENSWCSWTDCSETFENRMLNADITNANCHGSEAACAICGQHTKKSSAWCGGGTRQALAPAAGGRFCPGCGCANCDSGGSCDYTCTPGPSGCSGYPADDQRRLGDPLEVAQSTILKNDHGSCSACEPSCH
jgi:hypothetical protein